MKALACLLLIAAVASAQENRNVTKDPKLSDMQLQVDDEGRFNLAWEKEPRQLSALKVSDLPGSKDEPLSLAATYKCLTLEALVVENEEKKGKLATMLPPDVLKAVPGAASWCLSRNLLFLRDNIKEFAIADISAIVDAQAELDRREYNDIIEQYNKLLERHNALIEQHNSLLTLARSLGNPLAVANLEAARQRQINAALALYSLMPKYVPVTMPPPPVFTNPTFHCTTRQIGDTKYTDCN